MTKLSNAPVIRTQLVTYWYDLNESDNAEQAKKNQEDYKKLSEKLKASGLRCFNVIELAKKNQLSGGIVELECDHLFDNQWNTTENSPTNPSARIFDWYEAIYPNKNIKAGHYLVITDEIRNIRHNVNKCGYCGAHYWNEKGLVFCDQCLDSKYLQEGDLGLLRLVPVDSEKKGRGILSDAERKHLLPLYMQAQTQATTIRQENKAIEKRKRIEKEYRDTINAATIEHDGMIWFLNRNINIDNCIYYKHTNKFCFGWRTAVSDNICSQLLDIISEFPFDYEIKCADGRKLSN
jgi:hypothetical protein